MALRLLIFTFTTAYLFACSSSNRTAAVARAGAQVVAECQNQSINDVPSADIIWVIDESGSMAGSRTDLVNNANNFFARALTSGVDFRMGVTNVCSPSSSTPQAVGKFCSTVSTVADDLGGMDRFLLPYRFK